MRFTKMHGLGNSYIYIDMFKQTIEEEKLPQLAIEVADKNKGIGSDGMILVCPSEVAPVKMRIFNNDGSEAKNCGNGLRCVAKFAYEHGYVNENSFEIETLAGKVKATVHVEGEQVHSVSVDMGKPILSRNQIPMVGRDQEKVVDELFLIDEHSVRVTAVSMGNPHVIMFVNEIQEAPVEEIGPSMEKDERFPDWVNVEFVEVVSESEIYFRVWERGSGITQACGTGACAAVVASVLNGYSQKGQEVTVHLLGGDLLITWQENGHVIMRGAAEVICEGVFERK